MHSPIITRNYYAPLTSRVGTLEKVNIIHVRPAPHRQQQQSSLQNGSTRIRMSKHRVRFLLPTSHADKNSTEWRRQWEKPMTSNLRIGVLNGSIPSAVSDTGVSASAIKPSDPSIPTGIKSNTSFGGAFGDIGMATTINKLYHQLREPA